MDLQEFLPSSKRSKTLTDEINAQESVDYSNAICDFVESTTPDFQAIGELYPDFKSYLKTKSDGSSTIDFCDPSAVRELNRALLSHWFGIHIDLHPDHLCPTVTSRTNYIRWISDLLENSCATSNQVNGIDVGTGASCIYPLLGKSIYGWNFIASDVDPESLNWAEKNVSKNNWSKNISIVRAKAIESKNVNENSNQKIEQKYHILLGCVDPEASQLIGNQTANQLEKFEHFNFTMCNPPYFTSVEEKRRRKDTECIATESELATDGGEIAFIKQMIDESTQLSRRVYWFTTLLGKKSSINPVLNYLHQKKPEYVEQGELLQGNNTRWTIAWTFYTELKQNMIKSKKKKIRYTDSSYLIDTKYTSVDSLEATLKGIGKSTNLNFKFESSNSSFTISLYESSRWIRDNFETDQNLYSNNLAAVGIGPVERPKCIVQIRFQAIMGNTKFLSLSCTIISPQCNTDSSEAGSDPKTVFGTFARWLKAQLNS